MLQNIKELYGNKLAALDGDIGHVKDFYFDDKTWAVRYLVADTGSWLRGRLVLLSPHAFGRFDQAGKILLVNLSRKQIENSPSIESHKPVSRQYEEEYYRYYGWPGYWQGGGVWGMGSFPVSAPPPTPKNRRHHGHNQRDDIHLRSTTAVTGYHIQATDGAIGSVSGVMVDDKSWTIGELVVETGHWFSGKEILISPRKIKRISYEESKVFVNLTKAEIQQAAENDHGKAGAGNPGAKSFRG
jgi:uncharacterized protein YrrD